MTVSLREVHKLTMESTPSSELVVPRKAATLMYDSESVLKNFGTGEP